MAHELKTLLETAKSVSMSSAEKVEQRKSFVYGNTNIENSDVTRDIVDRANSSYEKKHSK